MQPPIVSHPGAHHPGGHPGGGHPGGGHPSGIGGLGSWLYDLSKRSPFAYLPSGRPRVRFD